MPRAEEAIVLVGGLGTRLRGVVPDLPKPLAPVAQRPFLTYVLDHFADNGMRKVILATGYLAEKVEQAIGRRWKGMEVAYSREEQALGTGGAVRLAATLLQGSEVHIANGDTFLRFDLSELENAVAARGCLLGVALAQVADVGRYGAVVVEDGVVRSFKEKGGQGSGLINAGSYFLTATALDALPADPSFSFEERVLLPAASRGVVAGFSHTSDFIDIGVPEDYALAQQLFAASA
jgi:D-glycero-alpha-D-manno-heptose 1-phosphate guanylyltransferase